MKTIALISHALHERLGVEVHSVVPVAGGDINDAHRAETSGGPLFIKTPRGDHPPLRIGAVELPNGPQATFAEFFAASWLLPLADASHAMGRLSADGTALMHRIADRLPELAGPAEPPARTHGDLWSGNVYYGPRDQPYLIDPLAHGGHREVDLATLRVFGGPGQRCFDAYHEAFPLADGHQDRVALWQLAIILLHVRLFGGAYEQQAVALARRYG